MRYVDADVSEAREWLYEALCREASAYPGRPVAVCHEVQHGRDRMIIIDSRMPKPSCMTYLVRWVDLDSANLRDLADEVFELVYHGRAVEEHEAESQRAIYPMTARKDPQCMAERREVTHYGVQVFGFVFFWACVMILMSILCR